MSLTGPNSISIARFNQNTNCAAVAAVLLLGGVALNPSSAAAESTVQALSTRIQAAGWYDSHYNDENVPHDILSAEHAYHRASEFVSVLNEQKARGRVEDRQSDVNSEQISVADRSDYFHGYVGTLQGQQDLRIGTAQHFFDIGEVNAVGPIYDPRFDRIVEGSTVEGANLFLQADIHWRNIFSAE
ncbi:MAG: hypothetical protein AAGF33_07235 [Pseudomonadota bacterium]